MFNAKLNHYFAVCLQSNYFLDQLDWFIFIIIIIIIIGDSFDILSFKFPIPRAFHCHPHGSSLQQQREIAHIGNKKKKISRWDSNLHHFSHSETQFNLSAVKPTQLWKHGWHHLDPNNYKV